MLFADTVPEGERHPPSPSVEELDESAADFPGVFADSGVVELYEGHASPYGPTFFPSPVRSESSISGVTGRHFARLPTDAGRPVLAANLAWDLARSDPATASEKGKLE